MPIRTWDNTLYLRKYTSTSPLHHISAHTISSHYNPKHQNHQRHITPGVTLRTSSTLLHPCLQHIAKTLLRFTCGHPTCILGPGLGAADSHKGRGEEASTC